MVCAPTHCDLITRKMRNIWFSLTKRGPIVRIMMFETLKKLLWLWPSTIIMAAQGSAETIPKQNYSGLNWVTLAPLQHVTAEIPVCQVSSFFLSDIFLAWHYQWVLCISGCIHLCSKRNLPIKYENTATASIYTWSLYDCLHRSQNSKTLHYRNGVHIILFLPFWSTCFYHYLGHICYSI